MFTLNPHGSNSSSSATSGWGGLKAQFYFFGKLATYFVALRLRFDNMSLTEEQKKRMEENPTDQESQHHNKKRKRNNDTGEGGNKKNSLEQMRVLAKKNDNESAHDSDGDDESLEDFEHNASEYITQTEAQRMYCVPLGTLAVCSYIKRDNPHKKGWSDMKLYLRSEVRRRARTRFGGKDGLIQERARRKENSLNKDLEDMKDVFC
ncbi:hypothetical protein HJC23_002754 [Cyclotella cryptica]|uniref:XPA C-terminal domain-containing protein n=1 Tax=Cyclotella cryptica TaxID=29204 RepID=A0ABD3PR95_9STRA